MTPEHKRAALLEDHRWMDEQLDRLMVAFAADDAPRIAILWDPLERFLLVHLDAEEALLFPELAKRHPSAVVDLLHEHAEIRAASAQLGLSLEIHSARLDVARSFASLLRNHAEREDLLAFGDVDPTISAFEELAASFR